MKLCTIHLTDPVGCFSIQMAFMKRKTRKVKSLQWSGSKKLVCDCTGQSAAKLIANISETIDVFTDTCPKEDDLTLIAIEVAGGRLKFKIAGF